MSAKYLSVFLNTTTPIISMIRQATDEMPRSVQLTGAVCKRVALAVCITPVMGLSANIFEYLPAIEEE